MLLRAPLYHLQLKVQEERKPSLQRQLWILLRASLPQRLLLPDWQVLPLLHHRHLDRDRDRDRDLLPLLLLPLSPAAEVQAQAHSTTMTAMQARKKKAILLHVL
jgi:hypothetical protein